MSSLIDAKIRALQVAVSAEIMNGRRNIKSTWDAVAVKKTQVLATGLYPWMNDIPLIVRKQANGYVRAGIQTQAFSLLSEEQGLFIEIGKRTFLDAINTQATSSIIDIGTRFGERIEQFPQDGVYGLFKEGDQTTLNGRSIVAYDGLSFFSDAHYVNGRSTSGGTYDNNLTGTALTEANFALAEATLSVLPDNKGKPLNQPVTHLVVPPQLRLTGAQILLAQTVATGGQNMSGNEARRLQGLDPIALVVAPELSGDATTWYPVCRAMGRAPVIYQETEALHVIPMLEETMLNVLNDNVYIWACKGEIVFGFGDPRTALRCIA